MNITLQKIKILSSVWVEGNGKLLLHLGKGGVYLVTREPNKLEVVLDNRGKIKEEK